VEEYLDAMNDDMKAALEALQNSLKTVRTGRATPQLLENVTVTVASYGATMPINQLATISAPDARLLVVSPWDKTTIPDIEKGILAAGLGLNPANDGQIVRVPIPALTGERRQDLAKLVRKYGEDAKIRARAVRKEYNDLFKGMEADKDISEDDLNRVLKKVQDATNATVKTVDGLVDAKEKDIQEV